MAEEKKTTSPTSKIISVVLLIIGIVLSAGSVVILGARPDEKDIFFLGAVLIIWGAYRVKDEKGAASEKKEDA